MLRSRFLLCLPILAATLVPSLVQAQIGRQEDPFEFVINPVVPQRADPWVFKHTDEFYYFTGSVPAYDRIELRRAETLQELAAAEPVTVWRKHSSGPMSYHIWAPELHFIDGKWYIYFAAGRADEVFDIRMYVLENAAANPLEGEWIEKGQLKTNWESFSLDATSFVHRGQRYLVWAQNDPDIRGNTNLYIAEMENPWSIRGKQVMLTKPEFDWEIQGYLVNEGAAVLKRNGRIFITYSGSATDARYAMGLLTANEDADLLDTASWTKSPTPVFVSNPENGVYGPGHNSFTTSKDGTKDVLVYHGRSYSEIMGNSLYDPNRQARMQVLKWNADGTPDFGVPVPDGPHVLTGTPPERPNRPDSSSTPETGVESDAASTRAVKAVVTRFLKAIGSYDLDTLPSMFAPNANVGTVSLRDGQWQTRTYTFDEFMGLLRARSNPVPYEEPVSEFTVHVEPGGLAFVLADATLFSEGQARSHNMDYFTLVKIDGDWVFLSASYAATPIEQ